MKLQNKSVFWESIIVACHVRIFKASVENPMDATF